jgi:hypothetical protein
VLCADAFVRRRDLYLKRMRSPFALNKEDLCEKSDNSSAAVRFFHSLQVELQYENGPGQ